MTPKPNLTLGIDLASQPTSTAICAIKWDDGLPEIIQLARGHIPADERAEAPRTRLHNRALKRAILGCFDGNEPRLEVTKVGIDAPFGWPDAFIGHVSDWHYRSQWNVELGQLESPEEMHRMELRLTDRKVWARPEIAKKPLSVSTDKLAYPALRCVTLLADLKRLDDKDVSRDGSGIACEVYPDPALRIWSRESNGGLSGRVSYKGKGNENIRRDLVSIIKGETGLRAEDHFFEQCEESDDCLDALVCALMARAVTIGATVTPTEAGLNADEISQVEREGWIHLPTDSRSLGLLAAVQH